MDNLLEGSLKKSRTEFIGDLINGIRVACYKARQERTQESIQRYYNLVFELFKEIRPYADQEEREELEKELKKLRPQVEKDRKTSKRALSKLIEFEEKLQDLRIKTGLDIPMREEVGESR